MRTKCDYLKCRRDAQWVVETSYSPVCLCTTHIGVKYLSLAAKFKSIDRGSEYGVDEINRASG